MNPINRQTSTGSKHSCFTYLALALLCLFPALIQAQTEKGTPAQSYIIGGLQVEGSRYADKNAVINYSGLKLGEVIRIPGSDLADAIKRLWGQSIFSDIAIRQDRVAGDKIFLTIVVEEQPRIGRYSFEGISKGQAESLKEKISMRIGSVLTEAKVRASKRVIRNFYVEKGYYDTKIDISSKPDPVLNNAVAVLIKVNRGKRIKIQQIEVSGNEAFSDKRVVRKLKKIRKRNPWRFWARSKYIPKVFREAKDGLITTYNNAGYRDARIEYDTVYAHDGKAVNLKLTVYEGQRYFYRHITWVGNYKYNTEQLQRVLGIERGDPYSRSKLQKRLSGDISGGDVSSLYMDDGYLFFQVHPTEVAVEGDSIDMEIRIVEGPQATIGKVIIEGNTKTSEHVIRRMLRTYPGKKFSRSDIIRSQREILSLGYFSQENLNVLPIPNVQNGTVDIKYVVEERPSDQLQVQGGWGARVRDNSGQVVAGGFVGTVQLAFNNFSLKRLFGPTSEWNGPVPSGDGQRLNLAIQMNGVGYRNFTLSFLEPWLGGKKPNSLGISTSYVIFQNFNSVYKNKILSTSLDFGRRLQFPDDFFRSHTSLTYKYYDINQPDQVFGGFQGEDQAYVNSITLRQSFDRTSVDAPIYPRSGSIMNLSVEFTPPYSLFRKDTDYSKMGAAEKFKLLEYHKWRFNSAWFWNILGNIVIHPKVEAGFLGAYNSQVGIPPFERFYLGGAGLAGNFGLDGRDIIALRGYADNSLNNGNRGFAIYNRYIMELRVPLTLNQAAPVWVHGFAEAGNGYDSFRNYNPFKLKRSLGVGMRVMLPMVGLLGLDYAYGFEDHNTIGGKQFHFIIGNQF